MKTISGFFKDDEGNLSSIRLVLVVWGVGLLLAWLVASIASRTLVAIPSTVVTLMGVFVGGKVGQKFSEDKKEATQGNSPATSPNSANNLTESLLPSLTATTLGGGIHR